MAASQGLSREHGGRTARSYTERFVRSIKRECLSKLIPIGAPCFAAPCANIWSTTHLERNHQGLDSKLIESAPVQCSKTKRNESIVDPVSEAFCGSTNEPPPNIFSNSSFRTIREV